MKYITHLFVITSLAFILTTSPAYAGGPFGGSTEFTQVLNRVQLYLSGTTERITAVQTTINTAKNNLGNPVLAAMITGAQQQAARDINNWARGNFQGNSTIITQPEQYVRNLGLEAVRGGIQINTGDRVSQSVFNAVVSSVRGQGDLSQELSRITTNETALLIQRSTCTQEKLNELARSEGFVQPGQIQNRVAQLYDSFCVNSPRTDQATAARLEALNQARPELTGTDGILLIASGQNDFARNMRAADAANRAQEKAELAAKADLDRGQGVSSLRRCIERGPAIAGSAANDYAPIEGPCLKYENEASSGQVSVSVSRSLTSGIDRLTNLGPDGFASLLGGAIFGYLSNSAVNAIRNTNDAGGTAAQANISYFGNQGFTQAGSGGVGTSGGNAPVVNRPTTQVTNRVYTQDLLGNDPSARNGLVNPINRMLRTTTDAINELEDLNEDYTNRLSGPVRDDGKSYGQILADVQTCFDNLIRISPDMANNREVMSALDLLKDRKEKLDTVLAILEQDRIKISEGRDLVTQTQARVTASNSSQEINDIFTNYQDQVDTRDLPTPTTAAIRMGQLERINSTTSGDIGAGNRFESLYGRCVELTRQVDPSSNPIMDIISNGG